MPIIPKLDGNTPIEDILESFRELHEKEVKKRKMADLKSKEKQNKKS